MLQPTDIELLLNQAPTRRLRFEHIVNELVDVGLLTYDQLVISPERTTAYNFERDVREIRERTNDQHQSYWQFGIPRDSFYDTLPERLFHKAKKRTKGDDEWAEIRRQEETQEKESRLFFLPFDNQFNRQRAAIARFESQTLAGNDEQLVAELLRLVAPEAETSSLTPMQRATLFLLITQAHSLVGNWPQTALYMSHFLGVPVHIRYGQQAAGQSPKQVDEATPWQPNRLGDGKLGLDWVLPQPAIVDDGGLIQLTIRPLTADQLPGFLPDGPGQRQLQLLAGYLFPVDADWQLDLQTDTRTLDDGFQLSDLHTAGRLGLTTTLAA
ncbi:type VI secretion system baseplate subunit TssG [Fibrivirga algicola]|uniref:Type VI secretion system baseplate subunit TssG n=1 Tax=Fibrivirga algicola TaxID=2950420 RepID=A0ABX0QM63_9BACT|nr:type VI secretion system baseplate subunit TssG [Fibrivirga algicola]NID12112.1 type VI secretion system baseplate subunit TssG [Fibrivirga algicola]